MDGSIDLQHDPHDDARAAASNRAERAKATPPSTAAPVADCGPGGSSPSCREAPQVHDSALDANRIAAIRERYARGVYDSPDVLEEVARRLLGGNAV